jgi:NAD+ kinase
MPSPRLGQVGEVDEIRGATKTSAVNGDDSSTPPIVQSRLLTKKQLSDMAWNVRALSKRLSSIKMKLDVKSVLLVTKPEDQCLVHLTRRVTRWLLDKDRETLYIVYVENRLENDQRFDAPTLCRDELSAEGRLKYWDFEYVRDHPHTFDFVITLGGDGTVLYASWLFQRIVPPVLSFALGSLGFLTKFDFEDHQKTLWTAFREGVAVSLRLRFECTIMRSKQRSATDPTRGERDLVAELAGQESDNDTTHIPDKTFQILNEVVVDRGPNPSTVSNSVCLGVTCKLLNRVFAHDDHSNVFHRNIRRR